MPERGMLNNDENLLVFSSTEITDIEIKKFRRDSSL